MHPSSTKHAYSLRNGRPRGVLLWLLAALAWVGCGADSTTPPLLAPGDTLSTVPAEERAAALALLDAVKQDAIQHAFRRLPNYAFTRRVLTEQLSPSGSVRATRERVVRVPPPDSARRPVVLHADSSGTFQFGWLDRFAPGGPADVLPTELVRYALPEDPAYLEPRTREAFRYRLRADTIGERPVRVIEIHAQPGELGADQAIRHARLYVDPGSHELAGLYLVRADDSVLFREDSRSLVLLRPAPDSGWVPARFQTHTRIKVPPRRSQAFRTTSTFSGYRAIE